MSEKSTSETATTLEAVLEGIVRRVIRQEFETLQNGKTAQLLTPEQLADRLKVPVSWVYEQSRQGKIPTHRIGRYIRFDLQEVIESQSTKT
jgi:excisionase family DNA binding protein